MSRAAQPRIGWIATAPAAADAGAKRAGETWTSQCPRRPSATRRCRAATSAGPGPEPPDRVSRHHDGRESGFRQRRDDDLHSPAHWSQERIHPRLQSSLEQLFDVDGLYARVLVLVFD